ncbi:hypothetical protein LWI29_020008 [Acer saccharum]|uniref:Auxin-responsive protein n=1 Tax=Acer saccharum TaxID=4024 RepID=A0AA39VKS0_ACESA|nr:hypothetical protein LWI29_020008 [Acer saccharum]KAK1559031.1 hypothetical protein Q3G72_009777 [Acer saccharum]
MESHDHDLNLKATELRLGLPGSDDEPEKQTTSSVRSNKRASTEISQETNSVSDDHEHCAPPSKAQVVGWPPIRSYRKNTTLQAKNKNESEVGAGIYVKVSVDGAPYLRKIDLKVYKCYPELLEALENMFKLTIGYNGSHYAPTYQDKDGDWMLVGDVPFHMFITSCKRLRIMRGSEARGLGSCV